MVVDTKVDKKEEILIKIDSDLLSGKLTKKEALVAYTNAGYTREKAEAVCKSILNDKVKFELGLR